MSDTDGKVVWFVLLTTLMALTVIVVVVLPRVSTQTGGPLVEDSSNFTLTAEDTHVLLQNRSHGLWFLVWGDGQRGTRFSVELKGASAAFYSEEIGGFVEAGPEEIYEAIATRQEPDGNETSLDRVQELWASHLGGMEPGLRADLSNLTWTLRNPSPVVYEDGDLVLYHIQSLPDGEPASPFSGGLDVLYTIFTRTVALSDSFNNSTAARGELGVRVSIPGMSWPSGVSGFVETLAQETGVDLRPILAFEVVVREAPTSLASEEQRVGVASQGASARRDISVFSAEGETEVERGTTISIPLSADGVWGGVGFRVSSDNQSSVHFRLLPVASAMEGDEDVEVTSSVSSSEVGAEWTIGVQSREGVEYTFFLGLQALDDRVEPASLVEADYSVAEGEDGFRATRLWRGTPAGDIPLNLVLFGSLSLAVLVGVVALKKVANVEFRSGGR